MDKFVFLCFHLVGGIEATKSVDHETGHAGTYPDVAVDYPDDVAFSFPVGSAHVSDLGVGTQVVDSAMLAREEGIFFFDENTCVVGWVIR